MSEILDFSGDKPDAGADETKGQAPRSKSRRLFVSAALATGGAAVGAALIGAGAADELVRHAIQPDVPAYRQLNWHISVPYPSAPALASVHVEGNSNLGPVDQYTPAAWNDVVVLGTDARELLQQQQGMGLPYQALVYQASRTQFHVGLPFVGQAYGATGRGLETVAIGARIGGGAADFSMGLWNPKNDQIVPIEAGFRELGRTTMQRMSIDFPGVPVG